MAHIVNNFIMLPTVLSSDYEDAKLGILDVAVLLEDSTQIDLEMQVIYFTYWTNRILFYLSRMYAGQLKKGEPYDKLKKCIHVSILNFIHFPEDKRCYHKICFCDIKTGMPYTDLMELHILELKKLPKKTIKEDSIVRWMRFFREKLGFGLLRPQKVLAAGLCHRNAHSPHPGGTPPRYPHLHSFGGQGKRRLQRRFAEARVFCGKGGLFPQAGDGDCLPGICVPA